jgi:hypothetical protein
MVNYSRDQIVWLSVTILDSDGERTMHTTDDLKMGKLYRLGFPGIAARVIDPPAGVGRSSEYCYLVESLVLRSRWWVNRRGEPDNIYSPHLIVPDARKASDVRRTVVSQH